MSKSSRCASASGTAALRSRSWRNFSRYLHPFLLSLGWSRSGLTLQALAVNLDASSGPSSRLLCWACSPIAVAHAWHILPQAQLSVPRGHILNVSAQRHTEGWRSHLNDVEERTACTGPALWGAPVHGLLRTGAGESAHGLLKTGATPTRRSPQGRRARTRWSQGAQQPPLSEITTMSQWDRTVVAKTTAGCQRALQQSGRTAAGSRHSQQTESAEPDRLAPLQMWGSPWHC